MKAKKTPFDVKKPADLGVDVTPPAMLSLKNRNPYALS
jgi:hypothetical protein